MRKHAQVLIITLWILVMLTVLAVSIGQRVSFGLRLSSYQRDKLKAHYLAKAGMNWAIVELEKDTNNYDALNESWVDNKDIFQKIMINEHQNEFATISYTIKEAKIEETKFGMVDEERKININTASKELLIALFEACEINPAEEIANYVLIWRGDIPDDNKIYENLGYPCKAARFSNLEELTLVVGLSSEDYQRLKDLITVYTDKFININTVSVGVLTIFTRGIAKSLSIPEDFADSVVMKIIELRNKNGYFEEKSEIDIPLTGAEELNIFNQLMNDIVLRSDNFLIEVTGNISKIKSKIVAAYNRKDKRILYWHET